MKDQNSPIEVLLVNPLAKNRFIKPLLLEIPMGLASLAGYLEMKGITADIFDMQLWPHSYEFITSILAKRKPKVVGITSYSPTIYNSYELARWIKEFDQGIFTVVGGTHASALPQQTMSECKYFDCLVYGEGEVTMYELVDNLNKGKDISNLQGTVVRSNGQIKTNPPREQIKDIDSLPFPARDKLELGKYKPYYNDYLRLPTTTMVTMRGCPYKCSFCSTHNVWGNSARIMSAKRVLEEIIDCGDKFNIRDFVFNDDVFTLSRPRVVDFCDYILKNKMEISWSCYSRVDTVDYELLSLMKEAGCFRMKYGVESGSQRILNSISKGITLQQARDAVSWTKEIGMECYTNFVIGFPEEYLADSEDTIAFAKELNPDFLDFRSYHTFPQSSVFKSPNKEGSLNCLINFEDTLYEFKKNNFSKLRFRAYLSFHLSFKWIWRMLQQLIKNPERWIKRFYYYGNLIIIKKGK